MPQRLVSGNRSEGPSSGADVVEESAKVEKILRRTHGTTITALRFGRDAMNRIQNHIEGGITDVYDVHHYSEENMGIMEAVAAEIMRLAEGRAAASGKVVSLRS